MLAFFCFTHAIVFLIRSWLASTVEVHMEGAYDPAEYEGLPVSAEIKELFNYISR